MDGTKDIGVDAGAASKRTIQRPRVRGLVITGRRAALAAMLTTTLVAALARAVGVGFQIPAGGEMIPLSGIAVMTGFFSLVGVVIAAGLLRWSRRPAQRFLWTALSLTGISLIAPLLAQADTATTAALLVLHLAAACVMVPTLVRALRTEGD